MSVKFLSMSGGRYTKPKKRIEKFLACLILSPILMLVLAIVGIILLIIAAVVLLLPAIALIFPDLISFTD